MIVGILMGSTIVELDNSIVKTIISPSNSVVAVDEVTKIKTTVEQRV